MLAAVHGFPPYAPVVLQTGGNYLYLGGQVGSTHFNGRLAMFELSLEIPNYMLSILDGGRETLQHKITSKLEENAHFTIWVLRRPSLSSIHTSVSSLRTMRWAHFSIALWSTGPMKCMVISGSNISHCLEVNEWEIKTFI